MGNLMDDALQWSREIAEFRKQLVPKVLKMEKEMMDLEFKRLIEWGDRMAGSGLIKEAVPEENIAEVPKIKPWCPPQDIHQLLHEIVDLKKMSASFRSTGPSLI